MKWALIYLLAAYGSGGNVVLWDTGFRYSSYDECTQQGISIRETMRTEPKVSKDGGDRFNEWSCVATKE